MSSAGTERASDPARSAAARPFDVATNVELALIGTRGRLGFALLFGLLSLTIHPWQLMAGWFAVLLAWEFVIRPAADRAVLRLPPAPAITAYAAVNFVGACLYAAIALMGLAHGSPMGVAIGATWLVGSVLNIFVYFGGSRRLMWACLSPTIAAIVVGPALAFGFHLTSAGISLLILAGVASMHRYALDRNALARTLTDRQTAFSEVERKLAVAIEASGDGLFELDIVAGEVRVSPTWARMLGYEPEELAGPITNWERFVHPDDRRDVDRAYATHFRGDAPHTTVEHRMIRKSGEAKWILARGRLVERTPDGRPRRVVGTIMDLSSRKALEQQLEAARDAAEAANQAKSVFLANMSHEIRTPLNGVIGTAGALARRPLSSDEREMLSLIQASGQTLDRLLSDILDQAKIEAGQFELVPAPFDLRGELEAATELMRARADEKGVALKVTYGGTARGLFQGDAVRIRQVVSNLASNAIKFTQAGEVRIHVDCQEPAAADTPAWLHIEVADSGIGFDAETAARLFTRFTQADGSISRRFGGSGLGLAICKALVELMQGEIEVASEPGAGATFTVRIPLPRTLNLEAYDSAETAPAAEVAGDDAPPLGRLRILLAEDHPTNQRVAQLILEPLGVELTIVGNGREALEAFEPGLFDVILMDMQMPVMDGLSATREIRRRERDLGAARTPLAMLTANAMLEHRLQASEAGADHLIAKPITPESLTEGVEHVMDAVAAQAPGQRSAG